MVPSLRRQWPWLTHQYSLYRYSFYKAAITSALFPMVSLIFLFILSFHINCGFINCNTLWDVSVDLFWVSLKATNKAAILARAVELSSCCLLKCCLRGLFAWYNVAVTLLNVEAAAVLVALQALSVIVSKAGWGDSGGVRYPRAGCIDLDFKPNLETYYPRFVPSEVT